MPPRESKAVRFLHVPKTAGTSVNAILEQTFQSSETFDFSGDARDDLERLRVLSPEHRSRLRLFRGHAPRYVGEPDVDAAETFTLLREPVARVISFCRHVAEGKSEYLLSSFPPDRFDLDEFLESGCPELNNFQSRMLLGRGDYADFDPLHDNLNDLEARLRTALSSLRFAGIQEKFEESMLLLGRSFGWTVESPRKKLNQAGTSRQLIFADRHLARLRKLNELDMRIYRHASETIADMIARNRVRLFLDRHRSRWRRRLRGIARPSAARLRASGGTS